MGQIYDTLISQFSNGLSFPKWASKMHPMFDKFRISTNLLATNTPYMKRIRAGPLAANIVSLMRQKCEGKMAHNVTIYSGKESTLVDLGEAMQFQYRFKGLANSGAAFAFELFEVGTICDTWNVEVSRFIFARLVSFSIKASTVFYVLLICFINVADCVLWARRYQISGHSTDWGLHITMHPSGTWLGSQKIVDKCRGLWSCL